MFFTLSKLVYWLIMPTSLIAVLFISAWVVKKKKSKHILLKSGVFLMLFFTNPFMAHWVMNVWEPNAIPFDQIEKQYKYGIVLTGITDLERPPFDRVQFNKGADRIVHAIDLYKRGAIEIIIISGGSGSIFNNERKESQSLADFAKMCGVSPSHLIIEDRSRNTRENALYTKELLQHNTEPALLITSAFHMSRAKSCFDKVGMITDIFPTDYYGRPIQFTPDKIIIPNVSSLKIWTILAKEWVGLISYWVVGYI
jgi:uncharacterized SAM-binding protein YcdF (DUF218 family)